MTIYVLICNGQYSYDGSAEHEGDRIELIKASTNYQELLALVESGKIDVADTTGWGVRAFGVYSVELAEPAGEREK